MVTPGGVVTTLAGTPATPGTNDGAGAAAQFYFPTGLAVDAATNVYVADCFNHTIRKVTPEGVVTTVAGTFGVQGRTDGPGLSAQFSYPYSVAVDTAGNVFIADFGNSTIRMLSPGGNVSTVGGLAGYSGTANGTGNAARFLNPCGIAVDAAGNLYVADTSNNRISKGVRIGSGFADLPNLSFYSPPGWTNLMVVAATAHATNDSASFYAQVPLYVSCALQNSGETPITNSFAVAYYVDGTNVGSKSISFSPASPLPPPSFVTIRRLSHRPAGPGRAHHLDCGGLDRSNPGEQRSGQQA